MKQQQDEWFLDMNSQGAYFIKYKDGRRLYEDDTVGLIKFLYKSFCDLKIEVKE